MARLCLIIAFVLAAGCARLPSSPDYDALDVRIAKLEKINAQYAAALAFLQQVYTQQQHQAQADEDSEPAPDAVFAVDVAPDVAVGQVDGPNSAYVTIVEGWDFACPYCQQVSSVLDELVAEYGGKVRVVYKNMIIHPQVATAAHLAGCAAANQGKFVAFKRAFWEQAFVPYAATRDATKLGRENIFVIAKARGLGCRAPDRRHGRLGVPRARRRRYGRAAQVSRRVDADVLHQRHARRGCAADRRVQGADRRQAQRSPRRAASRRRRIASRRSSARAIEEFVARLKDPKPKL